MNIIAPVRSPEQYDTFIANGANELYGGVLDADWYSQYGAVIEYNRRGSFSSQANFPDYTTLGEVLRRSDRDHIPFYLTMNAIGAVESQVPYLQRILSRFVDLGGRKVIVGNYHTMTLALEAGCEVTVSACAGVYNRMTARFWKQAGAERIILPRSITPDTVRAIKDTCGDDLETEVFMMNSGCKYSDNMCRSLHNTSTGALCSYLDHQEKRYLDSEGNELEGRAASAMKRCSFYYRQLFADNCNMGCGQCAIWELMHAGADSAKIVGRLLQTDTVTKCIQMTARNMEIAARCCSNEAYLDSMVLPERALGVQICRNHMNCYYRGI